MHTIRDTENKLNPVPEETIMVPSESKKHMSLYWRCIRRTVNNKNWKDMKKPDPEGDTKIIASVNEMQQDNCGLYHNSSCSLEYDYCNINHTKSKKSWCYLLL